MPENKKEKLKEFHRSNILEVAKNLFIENGFAQTTMDDVAKAADYSKSTLYVYFKSKDEIYSYIIIESMIFLKEMLEKAIKNNRTIKATFLAICNAHLALQDQNPLFFDSMINMNYEKKTDDDSYKRMLDLNNEINTIIADFLNIGIEKHEIKPDIDARQTAFALWSSICGLILFSDKKQSYIQYMGVSRQNFLLYSFNTLLNSILP